MGFSEQFYSILRKKGAIRGWQSSFAQRAGLTQSALSKIISGETKDPGLSTIAAILDALSEEGMPNLPATTPQTDVNEIPVYAIAGAGPGILPDQLEPLFTVLAPPEYFRRSNYAVMINGHSMEPLIPHGSIVGIRTGDPFQANELFLAEIPYEGLVVKRVGVDLKREEFVFKSQNPDKEAYPDFRLSIHEAENIILGRVVWVMVAY